MLNPLGYSVYLSTFEQQKARLQKAAHQQAAVFTSLHIPEETGGEYANKVYEMCQWLTSHGFRIIADVSNKTAVLLKRNSILELANWLNIWALRIDDGISEDEIKQLAKQYPIVLNASTIDVEQVQRLRSDGFKIMAMHNFYPRPETGLDQTYLMESTQRLQQLGIPVYAFIAGDGYRRGPLQLGLPTLEAHRNVPPLVAFADLKVRFKMDGIFVGDPDISEFQQQQINFYCNTEILPVPVVVAQWQKSLEAVYTCRIDSPAWMIRFQESRQYATQGEAIEPRHCTARTRGTLTQDNLLYGRYSGEIQLLRKEFPPDERVNVLGKVVPGYEDLLDCIQRGHRFCLINQGEG